MPIKHKKTKPATAGDVFRSFWQAWAKENIASIRGRLIDDFLHKTNPQKVFLSLMTNM